MTLDSEGWAEAMNEFSDAVFTASEAGLTSEDMIDEVRRVAAQ